MIPADLILVDLAVDPPVYVTRDGAVHRTTRHTARRLAAELLRRGGS